MSRNSGREGPDAECQYNGTQAAAVWHHPDARTNRPSALPPIGPWCNGLYDFCLPRGFTGDGGHHRFSCFSCLRTAALGCAKGVVEASNHIPQRLHPMPLAEKKTPQTLHRGVPLERLLNACPGVLRFSDRHRLRGFGTPRVSTNHDAPILMGEGSAPTF